MLVVRPGITCDKVFFIQAPKYTIVHPEKKEGLIAGKAWRCKHLLPRPLLGYSDRGERFFQLRIHPVDPMTVKLSVTNTSWEAKQMFIYCYNKIFEWWREWPHSSKKTSQAPSSNILKPVGPKLLTEIYRYNTFSRQRSCFIELLTSGAFLDLSRRVRLPWCRVLKHDLTLKGSIFWTRSSYLVRHLEHEETKIAAHKVTVKC